MAIVNGMAAHGGVIPFGSTFFTFSDYCRSAIRMGALQSSHSLYIFTHDSVALGEDGPTHQPVEHLMALRSIPQLTDFRPADANETSACWQLALERKAASFMALSRQDLPVLDRDKYRVFEGVPRGAYKLVEGEDLILVATGAEVHLILEAARLLRQQDIQAAVISMPSFKLFEEQASTYKNALFARATPTISVEAGATLGWYKYIGRDGVAIGLDRFGASAPGPVVLKNLGISVERVVQVARTLVATARRPALGQDSHP
jgi:transketolase